MAYIKKLKACLCIISILISHYSILSCSAQITELIPAVQFNQFSIESEKRNVGDKVILLLIISKNNQVVLTDSINTDVKSCTGFSVPVTQPFKDYFIFAKRQRNNGRIYILSKTGEFSVIPGGTFWAAPKNNWLFILAERDNTNLLIYDLKAMKTLVEKFNCDEFTSWYYYKGNYLGKVVMECGTEPEAEKEISEWMNPVVVEKFNIKSQTLAESHTTDQQLERAKVLVKYAGCK